MAETLLLVMPMLRPDLETSGAKPMVEAPVAMPDISAGEAADGVPVDAEGSVFREPDTEYRGLDKDLQRTYVDVLEPCLDEVDLLRIVLDDEHCR